MHTPSATSAAPMQHVSVTAWRAMPRGKLLGYATIETIDGLIIPEVPVFIGKSGPWAGAPSRPVIRAGALALDDVGRPKYAPALDFASADAKTRWSAGIVAALRLAHPDALATGDTQ